MVRLSQINSKLIALAAGIGASIPFSILLFIILTKEDVFETWMFIPLSIIPMGAALGGIFFYLCSFIWFSEGWKKFAAVVFSTIIYFVSIWISSVIAFNFTGHWN